jgi:hypothetical protein
MTVPLLSHKTVTAEAWVRPQVSHCEIYGGHSGTGIGFSQHFVFTSGGIALITKIRMITLKQTNALQLSEIIGQKRNLT